MYLVSLSHVCVDHDARLRDCKIMNWVFHNFSEVSWLCLGTKYLCWY